MFAINLSAQVVKLPNDVAKLVAIDLVKYDSCKLELQQCNGINSNLELKCNVMEKIADAQQTQLSSYTMLVADKNNKIKVFEQENNKLKRKNIMSKVLLCISLSTSIFLMVK